jgi:hypothetical protein
VERCYVKPLVEQGLLRVAVEVFRRGVPTSLTLKCHRSRYKTVRRATGFSRSHSCYIFQGGVQNGTTAIFALKNGTTAIFSFFFKYFFADLNHRTNSGIAHRSER